ncbi:MAG: response regulator transcription factor [candidate division Zixibacteria bacterium]|jgi:DNA-binding NarL/FixJ family response regulator|nr:response regulator transcription factor [candidate division Zixibacteria bacterium]
MKKIKVLLIEDNRLLRDGTTAMLNEQADIRAVSSAGNRSAFEKAKKLVPDVVLLDLGLRSRNSLRVLQSIKKQYPRTEIVVMDLIPVHSDVVEFVKAGVSGFIPKDATLDDFLHTIRTVVKGVKILPPTTADSLFSQIVECAIQGGTVDRVIAAVKLTKQEQDVICLLAAGKSITESSIKLKVAVFTVKNHVRNILDKLALHTRLELATFARTKGSIKKASVRDRESRD